MKIGDVVRLNGQPVPMTVVGFSSPSENEAGESKESDARCAWFGGERNTLQQSTFPQKALFLVVAAPLSNSKEAY